MLAETVCWIVTMALVMIELSLPMRERGLKLKAHKANAATHAVGLKHPEGKSSRWTGYKGEEKWNQIHRLNIEPWDPIEAEKQYNAIIDSVACGCKSHAAEFKIDFSTKPAYQLSTFTMHNGVRKMLWQAPFPLANAIIRHGFELSPENCTIAERYING